MLLVCSLACIASCRSQAISQPGGNPAAPANTAVDQSGRIAGPRGFQAALAAKRDRRHTRHLQKQLERQYGEYTGQTDASAVPEETDGITEVYEEEEGNRQDAAESQSRQVFPLIALAAAAFAAGVLLGYELGRAGSAAAFTTPDQPIPAMFSTSSQTPREEHEVSSSSPSMPTLGMAISQASEKQELRLHARTAAAAIESSSEADPKLFASAAGMMDVAMPSQLPQAEHVKADEDMLSSLSERTGIGAADNALQSQANHISQPVSFRDTTELASSSSPAKIKTSSGGEGNDAHPGSPGVEDFHVNSSGASAGAESSAEAGVQIPAALKAHSSGRHAQPECIEAASDREQQGSTSGQRGLRSMRREPDMLQSMQWVTSSGSGGEGRHQPEHWDRATAFWSAFTGKLDVSPSPLLTDCEGQHMGSSGAAQGHYM